jgi:mannose-6-phosphate isomerase-like protein (cupin superfamily)
MRMMIPAVAAVFLMRSQAADPTTPIHWTAAEQKELDQKAASRLNKETHLGSERLMDSAFILYRDGPSQAEIHTKQADFIVVREGEGAVLVGGKMIDGKSSGPDELRGVSIEGGTKYTLRPGESIYIPANEVHQFLVEPGKHVTATIIKITPKVAP